MNSSARFFLQHDRLHTVLTAATGRRYLRAPFGHLAAMRLEGDKASITMLGGDLAESVLLIAAPQQQASVAYCVYGAPTPPKAVSDLPAFNGQRLLSDLYLLGNGYRSYNPRLMRFQSPDTLSPFGVGGLNAYAYCEGDPVNLSDPSGHMRTPSPLRTPPPASIKESPPGSPWVFDWPSPSPRGRSPSPVPGRSPSPVPGPSKPTTARPASPDVPGEDGYKLLPEHEARQGQASNIAVSRNTPSTSSSMASSSSTDVLRFRNYKQGDITEDEAEQLIAKYNPAYGPSGVDPRERRAVYGIMVRTLVSGKDPIEALEKMGYSRDGVFVRNARYYINQQAKKLRKGS